MTYGNGQSPGEPEQQVDFLSANARPPRKERMRLLVSRALTDSMTRSKVAAEAVPTAQESLCQGLLEELLTGLLDHRVADSAELWRQAEKIEVQGKKRKKS